LARRHRIELSSEPRDISLAEALMEFDRDGRHARVLVWEDDGAVIVYDGQPLEEVTRLPIPVNLGGETV
jgi:hypothetical protein